MYLPSIPPDLLSGTPSAHVPAREITRLHEEFIAELRHSARLSPETLRGYARSFRLLTSLIPELSVGLLTRSTMTEFFRRLETRRRSVGGRERVGVKASSLATYRGNLNRFFVWLQEQGKIPANPLSGIPQPRVDYGDRKYLGRVAVERIFACLVIGRPWRTRFLRKRNLAIFAALLYSGLRKGELLAVHVTDLNLDRLELTVRAETSKSRMRRLVPINSALRQALEDYLDERSKRGDRSEYLFTSGTGDQPFTRDGLKHLCDQVQRASGERFHPHQFRHTFAVNFLNRGGDVAKLRQLLGHRDIRMTSLYLRCLPTNAMRADVENLQLDALL